MNALEEFLKKLMKKYEKGYDDLDIKIDLRQEVMIFVKSKCKPIEKTLAAKLQGQILKKDTVEEILTCISEMYLEVTK